jgi:uncharacterized membrane protein
MWNPLIANIVLKRRSLILFLTICFSSLFVYLFILLDIPVARQITGLIYFVFVPGLLLINIIGFDHIDEMEKILYSVGLSLVFLMVVGLVADFLGPFFGNSTPLSLVTIAPINCLSIVLIGFIGYLKKKDQFLFSGAIWRSLSLPRILILILPLVLAVAGAVLVNVSGNSLFLLFMVAAIAGIFAIGVISGRLLPNKYYSIALFAFSLALLFHSTLISNYIHGSDIHLEYYVFQLTQTKSYWDPSAFFGTNLWQLDLGRYHSMLSITVLPTEISNLLGLDATWTLKIIFPLLFALIPIGVYRIWKTQIGEKAAFISAFILIAEQNFFLWVTSMAREMIGELFFVILLLVLFSKNLSYPVKIVCFLAFSFGLVVSHYSMALIFLFFLSIMFIFDLNRKKNVKTNLSLIMVFLVIMISWYAFINWSSTLITIETSIRYIIGDFTEFFVPSSRGEGVLVGLGAGGQSTAITTLQMVSRIFAYAVEVLIVLGFVTLIAGRIGRKVDDKFKYGAITGGLLLGFTILIPGFASSLEVSRFYHISLLFLAPMFVLGCGAIVRLFFRRNNRKRVYAVTLLLLIMTVPYFLFQTNSVYEVTGYKSWSVPLSSYRMGVRPYTTEFGYVQKEDVFAAKWLDSHVNTSTIKIYTDGTSVYTVLTSYGMVPRDIGGNVKILTNETTIFQNSTIFLSKINIEDGYYSYGYDSFNQSQISPVLNSTNVIYNNGYSEIMQK